MSNKYTTRAVLIIGLTVMVAVMATIATAYFDDVEGDQNVGVVGILDVYLKLSPTSTLTLSSPLDAVSGNLLLRNDGNLPLNFVLRGYLQQESPAICNDVMLAVAAVDSNGVFEGLLPDFYSSGSIASSGVGYWNLFFSAPNIASSSFMGQRCEYSFAANAFQSDNLPIPLGFRDQETDFFSIILSPYAPPPSPITSTCPLSPGYWANNRGCGQGGGENELAGQIEFFSSGIEGLFASTTAAEICVYLWEPNCAQLGNGDKLRCSLRRHLLAAELNIVSGVAPSSSSGLDILRRFERYILDGGNDKEYLSSGIKEIESLRSACGAW